MTLRLATLLPILVLALAACAGAAPGNDGAVASMDVADAGADSTGNVPIRNGTHCAADGDCTAGTVCAVPPGICVQLSPANRLFSVLVDPGDKSDLLADQYPGVSVDAGGSLNLTLPDSIVVTGVVALADPASKAGQAFASNVAQDLRSGRLVATATGLIPGTQFRSEAAVPAQAETGTALVAQPLVFRLRALPGLAYDVTFIPDPKTSDTELPALPPCSFRATFEAGPHDIVLPQRGAFTRVAGTVVLGGSPVAGAQVRVQVQADPTTLLAGDPVPAGSASTQTGEDGTFQAVVGGTGALKIRVAPGAKSPLFPPKDFDGPTVSQADNAPAEKSLDTLDLGDAVPERQVAVQVVDQAGKAAVGQALVQAVAPSGLTAAGLTGADGVARLRLLDGKYRLAAVPPAESNLAAAAVDLVVAGDMNASMPLGQRLRVKGALVRQSDGTRVPGAAITLVPTTVDALASMGDAVQGQNFSAVSETDGSFDLRVDAGTYALTVAPAADSGFALFSQPTIVLSGGNKAVTVPMPDAALVRGTVRRTAASNGTPVAGAQVQFYFDAGAVNADGSTQPSSAFAASVTLAGTTTTDADGTYSLLVPLLTEQQGEKVPDAGGGTAAPDSSFGLPEADVQPL